MKGISGKRIVVTGGAAGLGRSAAILFAENGARVMIADVDEPGGRETVRLIEERHGAEARFQRADISRESDVAALIDATMREFGGLDHAFNNAGVQNAKKVLHELTLEEFERCVRINLTGSFLCMKYEIPVILQCGGGAIVNVTSVAGVRGNPTAADYCSAKFGVVGLTQGAALDYATKGLRVNSIAPGPMATPMIAEAMKQPGFTEWVNQHTPMGRFSDPIEQAQAAMWLLSDAASYVTGICMPVDGGFLAA
jgi:2,5-dichloro-2,5-cyclohexadiene-1,4-diol dehydrogenase 1